MEQKPQGETGALVEEVNTRRTQATPTNMNGVANEAAASKREPVVSADISADAVLSDATISDATSSDATSSDATSSDTITSEAITSDVMPPESASRDTPQPENGKALLRAPRSIVFDIVLCFATLGLYSCYWFFRTIKDLNPYSKRRLTPWLWFLVPLVNIVQLFAFPSFNKVLNGIEADQPSKRYKGWFVVGAIGFVLINAYFYATRDLSTPAWFDLLMLVLISVCFGLMVLRVNHIKQAIPNAEFKRHPTGYSTFEWILVLLLTPAVVGIYVILLGAEWVISSQDRYANKSYFEPETSAQYQLQFYGDDWVRVEAGSYSDGTALAEFTDGHFGNHMVLFDYEADKNLNNILHARYRHFEQEMNNMECEQQRSLVANGEVVKVVMECRGRWLDESVLGSVTMLQFPNRTYELFAYLSAPKRSYKRWLPDYRAMSEHFLPNGSDVKQPDNNFDESHDQNRGGAR